MISGINTITELVPKTINDFDAQEGSGPVTVQGFLADVEALKEKRPTTNIKIGLRFTEYQKFKDNELKAEEERERNGNFKQEIKINKRMMENLKHQKKKGQELYEKLEKDLTQFELEEEEEIAAIMANEHLMVDDSDMDGNIAIHDDEGMKMTC